MLRAILIAIILFVLTSHALPVSSASVESIQKWKNLYSDKENSIVDNAAKHYSSQAEFDAQMEALDRLKFASRFRIISKDREFKCMSSTFFLSDEDLEKINWIDIQACATK